MQNHIHSNSLERESVFSLYYQSTQHQLSATSILRKKQNGVLFKKLLQCSFSVLGVLMFSFSLQSQTLIQLTSGTNPLLGMSASSLYSNVRFVDIDGDGDQDAFIGQSSGGIEYFRNDGTKTTPAFTVATGSANPLNGIFSPTGHSTLGFADIDGDGDLDVFIGDENGSFSYYENQGDANNPNFAAINGAGDPFNGFVEDQFVSVNFVDIDGDGDLDAFINDSAGDVHYYKNTGSATNPTFVKQAGANNPFDGVDVGLRGYGAFGDPDCDGDIDAFFGNAEGVLVFENQGTALVPNFVDITATIFPNGLASIGFITPEIADLDGDGDIDFYAGEDDGSFEYLQNAFVFNCIGFTNVGGASNPLNGVQVNTVSSSSVAFHDFDGDGDPDAVVGSLNAGLLYFENTGTKLNPVYVLVGGVSSPFNGISFGQTTMPIIVDIDCDGDMDVFVGQVDGTIQYLRNDGTATNPSFVDVIGAMNPFNGVDVGQRSAPTFGDIDGDGDLDCFIGEQNGTIKYYKNNGTKIAPNFTLITGTANPLHAVNVFQNATPMLKDMDKDGDLDVVVGRFNGIIKYYKNIGNANTPFYQLQTGTDNPFNGVSVGSNANIAFVDVDGDGDCDAFIGAADGKLYFWRNNGCSPLPVELAYFNAHKQDERVLLDWMTVNELNNDGFEIERSFDGKNWENIGFVAGQGTTNTPTTYDFVDNQPMAGTNYYRLKQVDLDAEFEYSSIRVVEIEGATTVAIFPNPVTDFLNLELSVAEQVTISIFDMSGIMVQQEVVNGNRNKIDLSTIGSGFYVVKIIGNQTQAVQKIIKQ